MMVYLVTVVHPDGYTETHIFSTPELASSYADKRPEPCVLSDYAIDCPERNTETAQ